MGSDLQNIASSPTSKLTSIERDIAELWKEVLELDDVPERGCNFFELGGDSIAMIAVELRINEAFGIDLPSGTLLGTPTLSGIASLIEGVRDASSE